MVTSHANDLYSCCFSPRELTIWSGWHKRESGSINNESSTCVQEHYSLIVFCTEVFHQERWCSCSNTLGNELGDHSTSTYHLFRARMHLYIWISLLTTKLYCFCFIILIVYLSLFTGLHLLNIEITPFPESHNPCDTHVPYILRSWFTLINRS